MDEGQESAVSGQQSAGSSQQSAASGQQGADSGEQAAGGSQPAAVSNQQPAEQTAECGLQTADGTAEQTAECGLQKQEFTEEQLALFPDLRLIAEADKQLELDLGSAPGVAKELPFKYVRFAEIYCRNGYKAGPACHQAADGTIARNSAYVIGSRWLRNPRIQAEIARQLEQVLADGRLSKEAFLTRLRGIIHADPADFLEQGEDGTISIKDLTTLTPEQTAAIKKLTVNKTEKQRNGGKTTESTVNIELLDPMRAIELAAKMLEIIGDKVDLTTGGEKLPGVGNPLEIIVRREPTGIALQDPGARSQEPGARSQEPGAGADGDGD